MNSLPKIEGTFAASLRKYIAPLALVFIGLALSLNTLGQQRKLDKVLDRADKYFEQGDYSTPISMYEEIQEFPDLLVGDEDVINYRLGYCYMHMGFDNDKALTHFQSYLENDNEIKEAYLYTGKMLQLANRYDEAISHYVKFADVNGKMDPESLLAFSANAPDIDALIASCELAKTFKQQTDKNIIVENLGDQVNSKHDEYGPVISPDGQNMLVTKRQPGNLGGRVAADSKYYEDIYQHKIEAASAFHQWFSNENRAALGIESQAESGLWSVSNVSFGEEIRLGGGVNSEMHDGAIQFVDNGNSMYFFRYGRIYKTTFKKGKWGKPKLRHEFKGVFDTKSFEPSMYMSSDEKTIFFSSDRAGGYGGLDIWISEMKGDSTWSIPVNAGPLVNTSYDDDAPRYLEESGLLFFASKGHNSIGGYDLFVSKREEGVWRQALNLGMPVNSTGDDTYLIPGLDKSSALFSSNRNWGHGGMDVYSVSFPTSLGEYYKDWTGIAIETAKTLAVTSPEKKASDQTKPDPVVQKADQALQAGDMKALIEQLKSAVEKDEAFKAELTALLPGVVASAPVDTAAIIAAAQAAGTMVEAPNTDQTAALGTNGGSGIDPTGTTAYAPLKKAAGFEIQIGSFDAAVHIERLHNIDAYKVRKDGKWNKVYYGEYVNIADAKEDLKRIQGLGFKDAFVVPMGYKVNK